MKKALVFLMALCLIAVTPIQLQAAPGTDPVTTTAPDPVKVAEAEALLLRLAEIDAMDKSDMKSPEKKELRKEVRTIKSELNTLNGGGVYISVGAIIIILLLLIILL
jgi:hypothetical protein